MESNNTMMYNTEEYSLSELFSTPNRKIIVPDFQRDYCWGDKVYGEKGDEDIVSGFLDTLFDEFKINKNGDVLLGKIDVYGHPENYIYLTDGQQRLTTLYLTVGMLYRQTQDESLKKCLIFNDEKNYDVQEPYLQYAIRESTVFFLRDLVKEFFIKNKGIKISDINSQSWYFNDYNFDPTIISMLLALQIIDEKLMSAQLDKIEFSKFIINRVKIQYYDVGDREHGEDRFVIINTTGKTLTISENVKPILLGGITNLKYAKQWEERETWFWKNKKTDEHTADNGVKGFLEWCFKIIDKQEAVDFIKKAKNVSRSQKATEHLDLIQNYFESLKLLLSFLGNENIQKQLTFINDDKAVKGIIELREMKLEQQHNVLIPLLSFIEKIKDESRVYQFLRRLRKNYFDYKWKDRKENYLDWRYVLQIIEKSESLTECLNFSQEFTQIGKLPKSIWFNEEEKQKIKLSEDKAKIEEWEDHADFMGDLTFLFQTAIISANDAEIPALEETDSFNFSELEHIFQNYEHTIDLVKSEAQAISNVRLANMIRLFRLFIQCDKVGHIYRASWEFEGVRFSTLNRKHLSKIEFMRLLNDKDLLNFCTLFIKQKVKEQTIFDLADFKVDKFIKAWLTLKVFNANMNNKLLAFYDGDGREGPGVAAYIDRDENKLMKDEEFSLANSICGFGVRSGFGAGNYVSYTNNENWLHHEIIDTPFSDISIDVNKRSKEQLDKNGETINNIIKSIEI